MRRLPLADQLPYRFYPPRIEGLWLWLAHYYTAYLMRKQRKVVELEFSGQEHLQSLKGRADGVLIAPNHAEHADCGVIFHFSRRVCWPFYYMAAYQIFTGIGRVGLPRIGVFPVDREGSDLTAFKTAVEILAQGRNPLVVFPEGEIYTQADKLTPLREGAGVLAAMAHARAASGGKTVWVVPVGIKYRFLEGENPLRAFHELVDDLESRFTWRHWNHRSLVDRIYRFAEGMLGLKELEYLGAPRGGSLKDRLAQLRDHILERMEEKRLGKHQTGTVPERVKELRHACLERLAQPETAPEEAEGLRHDLEDLFGVMQLFSYPGDYIRESPTLERVAEILMKLEEDVLGVDMPAPRGLRKAVMRVGEPINMQEFMGSGRIKPRALGAAVTSALEARIQGLLDAIGPGRPLVTSEPAAAPNAPAPPAAPELQSSSA